MDVFELRISSTRLSAIVEERNSYSMTSTQPMLKSPQRGPSHGIVTIRGENYFVFRVDLWELFSNALGAIGILLDLGLWGLYFLFLLFNKRINCRYATPC